MIKNFYLLIFISSLLFSCKENNEVVQQPSYDIYSDTIPSGNKRVQILKLKSAIRGTVTKSESFNIVSEYMDSLNTVANSEINDLTYILNEHLEELPRELDSTIKTRGVLSRIKQIETYSSAVLFEISKMHKDTSKINKHLKKTINSYNDLIYQLNETNSKLHEDFKKQLEKVVEIKKDTIEGVPLF